MCTGVARNALCEINEHDHYHETRGYSGFPRNLPGSRSKSSDNVDNVNILPTVTTPLRCTNIMFDFVKGYRIAIILLNRMVITYSKPGQ